MGRLNVFGKSYLKFINFLIHDNRQGVSWWVGCTESELYGAIVYDNGWPATDRGHGHCVYTQNNEGVKRVTDCIFTCKYPGTYTMHAYGSRRADCNNYTMEGNIAYALGTFLVGSGKPSHNIVVQNNALHGIGMQIGYNAPHNENCEVRDNIIVNGGLSIVKYKQAVNEGNLILAAKDERPAEPRVFLRPNKYDPTRAHLAVYNFAKAAQVAVDASAVLKDGDAYALQDPKHFYGPALHTGKAVGGKISVPMAGEFTVFVLLNMSTDKWKMLRVYGEAEALYAEGRFEEALKLLADAGMAEGELAGRMRQVAANAAAAEKATQAGDIAAARKAADAVLAAEPKPENVYRKRAQAVVARLEKEAAALIAKGQAAMAAQDLPAAGAAYKQAATYAPDHPDIAKAMTSLATAAVRNLNLAINFRVRDRAKAVELLRGVLAILPEDHPSYARAKTLSDELAGK